MLTVGLLWAGAACTSVGVSAPQFGQAAATSAEPAPIAAVTASPAFGDQHLSPVQPVTISVAHGRISTLTLTNPHGTPVAGTFAPDRMSWTLREPLGYGKTYTVTGTALGTDGRTVPITGRYTTVTPVDQVNTSISPGDGAVVGSAAPVIVHLGSKPADRALIQKHVSIITTPHVPGGWAWLTHDGDSWPSLDFRPKNYWPAGTRVHVQSDLYGLNLGGGHYGGDNITSDFTIGRNQVVLADANAHTIVVQHNGVTVATYPASFGSGDDIGDPPTGSPAPASTWSPTSSRPPQ